MVDENESVLTAPVEHYDIAKLQLETEFEKFLEHPLTQTLEAITGAFAVGVKQLGLATGRMAQAILKGKMYDQCAEEWRTLRNAGKLPDNLGETKRGLPTWAELMRIIDDECPDEEKLEALKSMFYAVNKTNAADWERIQAYQLWNVTKQLTSGELYLLRCVKQEINFLNGASGYNGWASHMAKKTGYTAISLISLHEKRLTELFLLSPRSYGDLSGIDNTNGRLTDLGLRLCANIETYEIDLDQARRSASS